MSTTYQRFGGALSLISGFAGLVYLVSFLSSKNPAALPAALSLLVVGVCASAAIAALYHRVRAADEGFALWGLLLGVGGAVGAAIHAASDLANIVNPPQTPFPYASPVDPRGFVTFAVSGLATIVLASLVVRGTGLPRTLGYLGLVSGVLLVLLYVVYMIILNPLNPLVLALILVSGLLQPIWYLWLGFALWQGAAAPARRATVRAR